MTSEGLDREVNSGAEQRQGVSEDPGTNLAAGRQDSAARPRDWALSIGSVALCTAASMILSSHLTLVDLAMLYLLGIVVAASRTGRGPSLLATALSVASFDFFFVPPYYTFAVSEAKYVLTFAVMFVVYFITSSLTLRVREQSEASRQRERRTSALYNLSRELAQVRDFGRLCAIAVRHIGDLGSRRAAILVPDEKGDLHPAAAGLGLPAPDEKLLSTARRVFDQRKRAGSGAPDHQDAQTLYLPLVAATGTMGVIVVFADPPANRFPQEHVDLLQGLANQVAMALERAMLAEEAQQAQLKAEREALRSTLLSSVSHDLRTPLAAITGAATTLLQHDSLLEQPGRQELIRTVCEEAERLNRIIRNVLDMTRIESGPLTIRQEWQSLEEIVGAVLHRLREKSSSRPIAVNLPPDLPLIPFDPLLMEQALTNLVENALKHTPDGTPVELSAAARENDVMVEIADRGAGIKLGDEERVFEKFVHGGGTTGGIGLGLTICRAIIQAHGGSIRAENRPGGGALFRFTLPLGGTPPQVEPELEPPHDAQQDTNTAS